MMTKLAHMDVRERERERERVRERDGERENIRTSHCTCAFA